MELVMETGAEDFDWIKALTKSDKSKFKEIAHTMREDGPFVEAGENDNLIVQKLNVNPDAVGIFGFSFLDQNTDKIQGAFIDGVEPTFEAIADGQYPVSRPLYLYVKKAHAGVIPGINEFLHEFTSEKAWGEDGYLADKGMIPMPDEERAAFREDAQKLNSLTLK
jgi:phosphate transport system substrate-binding protein